MVTQAKSLDEIISDITISIGIPANIIGSAYISEAVKLVIENYQVAKPISNLAHRRKSA